MLPVPRLAYAPKGVPSYILLAWCLSPGGYSLPRAPRKTALAQEEVKGQGQSMWNNSSGRTPKSCSSLFDLKEVVQRQQQPSSWGGSSNSSSGARGGRAPSPPLPTCRGGHWWKMMDFLKNILVSVPRPWRNAHPGPAALRGWAGEEPESLLLLPGREPLVALGLL